MATLALTDCEIHVDELDLASHTNQVAVEASTGELDDTCFGDDSRSRKSGLRDVSFSATGFRQDDASVDEDLFAHLGLQRLYTVAVDDTAGSVAYFGRGRKFQYNQTSTIGEMAGFNISAMGSDGIGVVRGQLLFPRGAVTGSANGTGFQMGAVGATESLYVAIHVFSAGTTATVIVESDDNSGFTTATTRTSEVVTSAGGVFETPVAGAITDDYWRVRFASVTGTFSIAVAAGIQ